MLKWLGKDGAEKETTQFDKTAGEKEWSIADLVKTKAQTVAISSLSSQKMVLISIQFGKYSEIEGQFIIKLRSIVLHPEQMSLTFQFFVVRRSYTL